MKRILISIIIFISACHLNAQQPPCMPDYYGLTYQTEMLQQYPPLSIYMPFDVLLSYIALDSVCHNTIRNDIIEFLNRQTYNDTIRYLMRFYYNMVDFDPILFMKTFEYLDSTFTNTHDDIEHRIMNKILESSPEPLLHKALLKSSYILHVRIIDTLRRLDPSAVWAKTAAIVTCEILDTIKGKVLPQCKDINIYLPQQKIKKEDIILDFPENCVQFEYRLEWEPENCGDVRTTIFNETGKIITPRLVDTNDIPWIKTNNEYILFLKTGMDCTHNDDIYYEIVPFLCDSKTYGMLPVINGFVQDPGNEFGLGTVINVDQFKTFLETKINEILQYNGN